MIETYTRKVPFLDSIVKYVTYINLSHGTCTCTEEHNVGLVLYGKIWQLSAAGFCVGRMWRYYYPFLPRVVSPDRRLLKTHQAREKT